jgi:predicted Zn-dependent protease
MMLSLVPLLFLALMQALPAGTTLSDADESRIGHMLAVRVAKMRGLKPSPQTLKIDRYLQTVGDRIAAAAPRRLHYRFRFDPDPGFKSAFALPGGEIFVGGGVLAFLNSEDQLAVILGHEIEHVVLNHCRDRLQNALIEQHLSPADSARLKVESFFRGYGHDGELAADREGVKLASAAGYSPKAAVRLLEIFLLISEQSPDTPNDSNTMLRERIAQILSVIEENRLPIPSSERPLALP